MADGSFDKLAAARAQAWSTPLDQLNPGDPARFRDDTFWPVFERLRKEDPIHSPPDSEWGPDWSITRFDDIVAVDSNHQAFSSEAFRGVITIRDPKPDYILPNFIAMDPPKHDVQRKTVSPVVSPANLMLLEPVIRERAGRLLDELPIGEAFNWVDRISIELTTQMLATLFDFPWEDRRKLTRWSDVATAIPGNGIVESEERRRVELRECLDYFTRLWNERVGAPPRNDLISMLAHGEHTQDMDPMEYLGNIILLIVGGNDTTRNSISGGLLALNQNPAEYDKLRADPSLIPSMVSEIIRWQTPLAHMRRTCTQDTVVGGKTIRAGDKVVMWYVSGNRDETVIDDPDAFIIDRERPRHHLSFGFGIHRCVGNRLAEMQLRIVWEEVLKRFPRIDVVGEPTRVYSSFVKGYDTLPVVIPARA
ncbi:MAG: cytochrome [Caulobacter sp.]|nr:cytochrome [Caulobacter sp.]